MGPVGLASDDVRRALDSMPHAFLTLDREFRVAYLNAEAERVLDAAGHDLLGRNIFDAFPEAVGTPFEAGCREVFDRGQPVVFEAFYPPLDAWFEVHGWLENEKLHLFFSNINERRAIELQRAATLDEAERANARLRFLTEVSRQLTGVRDEGEVFDRLTQTVVPAFADWCTLVVPQGEELVRVAAVHRDRALDGLAKRLVGAYPHAFSGPSPGVVVYRSGEPLLLHRLAKQIIDDLDDSAPSAAYGRTLQLLGEGPGLIMPIAWRGDVVAVLTMVRSSGDPFTDADVAVMHDVVGRVAGALEEARHIAVQREIAGAFQAVALPTELPRTESIELAAGYRAASQGSQVGGDWYDAFKLPSGRIALVVGDAAGHGLQAAAVMAQMRNALRAYLFASFSPAESLTALSKLLAAHDPDAFATVICVVVDPRSGKATWASAGHLAPILVSGDGTSEHLRGRPAPPIGWSASPSGHPQAEHQLDLRTNDRLLMFTDGLVERREVDLEIGIAHLMIFAEQTRPNTDVTAACQMILDDMLAASHQDDVCLLIADFKP